jgi:antitoxin (DNA-binding transcriptional repressor) of toxin-antitoxin stability system
MAVTITKFRQKLFQLADQALEGETIEFIHKGVTFKVVPQTRKSKLSRLTAENIFAPGVDPDSEYDSTALLKEMEAEWEKDWAEL